MDPTQEPAPSDERHAGGTYAPLAQSAAARRSEARTEQRYDDSGAAEPAEESAYGQADGGHSGYGSSGQGQFGAGGFAQGGQGRSGYGVDYGQKDPTRSDAATKGDGRTPKQD